MISQNIQKRLRLPAAPALMLALILERKSVSFDDLCAELAKPRDTLPEGSTREAVRRTLMVWRNAINHKLPQGIRVETLLGERRFNNRSGRRPAIGYSLSEDAREKLRAFLEQTPARSP